MIYEVGVYTSGEFRSEVNGKQTKEHATWKSMLVRCYSKNTHKLRPTYIGCTVSENFKNFQYFAEWCQSQIGFGNLGWEFDKDLLIKGNKVYSEDTCVFIPREINVLLTQHNARRGEYPIGVSLHKTGKYQANISTGGKLKYLGLYESKELAFCKYKEVKELYAKTLANKYKESLHEAAFSALMNWEVNIDE